MKGKRFNIDFSSMDFSLNFDLFGGGEDESDIDADLERQFIKAAKIERKPVLFDNAVDMVNRIDLSENYFALVSGSFIFGDFIEALCYARELRPNMIYMTTLGMSYDNADSIVNLVDYLGCGHVNLIVSNYFTAIERYKLIPYMINEFSGKPINVAVLASHCKICLIECADGKLIIEGSANLSSSCNVEQFSIIHDDNLFDWLKTVLDGIVEKHTVIDGINSKTIFKNNSENTGRKAFEHIKRTVEEKWQLEARDGAVKIEAVPKRKAQQKADA